MPDMKILCDYCENDDNYEPSVAIAECEPCKMTTNTRTTLCRKHIFNIPTAGGVQEACQEHKMEYMEYLADKYKGL